MMFVSNSLEVCGVTCIQNYSTVLKKACFVVEFKQVLVTGSLYLVGDVLRLLKHK